MQLVTQGVHHITITGADRQSTIDFWEGVLGMPFVFEQPNLDAPDTGHLYFDPGDGRLITVFTDENRRPEGKKADQGAGYLHHLALNVSRVVFEGAKARLEAAGHGVTGPKDRGFMDSLYFRDPCGMLIELATYVFEPPQGKTHADVLARAFALRQAAGDAHIMRAHVAQALAELTNP